MSQYATADEFRAVPTGAPNSQYTDAMLDYYLQVASTNVEQFCERVFEQTTYTERFRGDGSTTHLVYEYPIVSVTSLSQSTIATTPVVTSMDVSKLVTSDDNFRVGRIELSGLDTVTSFSPSSEYTVVYVGGFSSIPIAVKHATILWAAELLRPDYAGVRESAPEIIPLTSEQISELLTPIRRRRI